MTLKLITDATIEPVDLATAKLQLRIETDITSEDARVTRLIQAAREEAEHRLGRALITQTWERVLDAFPAVEVELGYPPVASVVSVKYIDLLGVEQTLGSSLYATDFDTLPGWVLPAVDTDWPDTKDTTNAVRIRFTTGAASAASVPASVKDWILLRIESLYRNTAPSEWSDRMLDRYTVYGI